jgi:deazaflavin-dependent oxidoreductase (nitroreductase family)
MRLPEPLFLLINPVMRMLLRSPLHFVQSRSVMLITFTGRKSGRRFTTPVRYVRIADTVRCFTSAENQWWRNLRGGAEVSLRIAGKERLYRAVAIQNDPTRVRDALKHYLALFPQDAAYHDIRLNRDNSLVEPDLEQALQHAVVVESVPIESAGRR